MRPLYASMPRIMPTASRTDALRILASGAAGLAVWEAFARLIAPLWLGYALQPADLIELSLGISGTPAQLLHIATGLLVFPAAYALVVRPLAGWLLPSLPWPALGVAYGVGLWIFALYVMAHLVGGMPAFLDFDPVAWASLVGHVLLGVAIAAMIQHLGTGGR